MIREAKDPAKLRELALAMLSEADQIEAKLKQGDTIYPCPRCSRKWFTKENVGQFDCSVYC